MALDSTVYERMVAQALAEAGAPAGAEVMLAGHSQGGIVAMNAAAHSGTADFPYNVTHVVTAGSPVGRIEVPDTTQVLSVENAHDIVPHLDGTDNPDTANRTTVTFEKQLGVVGSNHSITTGDGSYDWAAEQLDQSEGMSVQSFVETASGYFYPSGDPSTHAYQLTRR